MVFIDNTPYLAVFPCKLYHGSLILPFSTIHAKLICDKTGNKYNPSAYRNIHYVFPFHFLSFIRFRPSCFTCELHKFAECHRVNSDTFQSILQSCFLIIKIQPIRIHFFNHVAYIPTHFITFIHSIDSKK